MNSTKTKKYTKLDNGISETSKDKMNKNHGNTHGGYNTKSDLVVMNNSMDIELKSAKIYKQLTTIDSRLNRISPNVVQSFKNIIELDLTNNNLNNIPKTIIYLSALESLILDGNRISQLPKVIKEMVNIKKLSLATNGLTQFPLIIIDLKNIEILNLSDNKLKDLPSSCKQLENLQILNISKNQFYYVPKCIQIGFPNLKTLDVSENKEINLNGKIFSKNLKNLYAKNNGLVRATFPGWIFYSGITEFDEINFENTCFEVINTRKTHKKVKIKKLNLEQIFLNDKLLSMILRNIDSVNYLTIGNTSSRCHENTFTEFPKEFNNPQEVMEITINRAGLSTISKTIENFTNVIKLELRNNSLSWLPDEVVNLKLLEILIINNNSLVMLPENVGQMISLKILDASNNSISSVPESTRYFKNIEFIDLYNNLINDLPKGINTLTSLKGLDLEQNIINTADLKLPASYENLRDQLGDDNNNLKLRNVGPRIFQTTPEESRSSSFCSDDYTSESSRNSSKRNSDSSQGQNNWNTEYDSSDEFDPFRPPIAPVPQPQRYIMYNRMEFCPADLHARRIHDVLAEKYAQRKLTLPPLPVEGQFDDAE